MRLAGDIVSYMCNCSDPPVWMVLVPPAPRKTFQFERIVIPENSPLGEGEPVPGGSRKKKKKPDRRSGPPEATTEAPLPAEAVVTESVVATTPPIAEPGAVQESSIEESRAEVAPPETPPPAAEAASDPDTFAAGLE